MGFSQRLEGDKRVIQADVWEKNIPGKRNIKKKDLKLGKSLAHMKNIKEPAVTGDWARERVAEEEVRWDMEGPSFVAIIWTQFLP